MKCYASRILLSVQVSEAWKYIVLLRSQKFHSKNNSCDKTPIITTIALDQVYKSYDKIYAVNSTRSRSGSPGYQGARIILEFGYDILRTPTCGSFNRAIYSIYRIWCRNFSSIKEQIGIVDRREELGFRLSDRGLLPSLSKGLGPLLRSGEHDKYAAPLFNLLGMSWRMCTFDVKVITLAFPLPDFPTF